MTKPKSVTFYMSEEVLALAETLCAAFANELNVPVNRSTIVRIALEHLSKKTPTQILQEMKQ